MIGIFKEYFDYRINAVKLCLVGFFTFMQFFKFVFFRQSFNCFFSLSSYFCIVFNHQFQHFFLKQQSILTTNMKAIQIESSVFLIYIFPVFLNGLQFKLKCSVAKQQISLHQRPPFGEGFGAIWPANMPFVSLFFDCSTIILIIDFYCISIAIKVCGCYSQIKNTKITIKLKPGNTPFFQFSILFNKFFNFV